MHHSQNDQASGLILPLGAYELTDQDKARFADEQALGMASPQHSRLSQVAQAVPEASIASPRIQTLVARLLEVAGSQQRQNKQDKKRRTLVGLAAPQVGESVRIIAVDTRVTKERKYAGRLECFINPEIIWRSRETEEWREGCFSAGPVWGVVRRAVAIKVSAFTPEGKKVERVFEGFTACIFQHEIDHLAGIRFPERIAKDSKRHWVHSEEIPTYATQYKTWPRLCDTARWEAFKRGES